MAKKNEIPQVETVDMEAVLIKDWTNPEGGAARKAGHKLTVTPELYALMESQGVVKSKETLKN